MRRFLSISSLLQAITGLMAVSLVATFAVSARDALERRQLAQRLFVIADISRDMFKAIELIRVERDTVNTALKTRAAPDAKTRSEIAALRGGAERTLDSALAELDAPGLEATQAAQNEIRQRREAFALLRQEADAALALPHDERPPHLSVGWIAAAGQLVEAVDALSEQLLGDTSVTDPFIIEMMQIKQFAWVAWDAAGDDRLLVGAAIARAQPLSLEEARQFAVLRGRIDTAWKLIEDAARRPTTPVELANAVATAKGIYFDHLDGMRRDILEDLFVGKPAAISGGDWIRSSNLGLGTIVAISETALDAVAAHAAEQVALAKRKLYIATVLAALSATFGVLATLFVVWRIAGPMVKITEAVRSVAQGELAGVIPFSGRRDEIGQLADALATFRADARERLRIEGELRQGEELRQTAENLRRSEEHLARAQRIANMGSDVRDLATDVAEWSDETFRIFGVSRESFTPTTANFLSLVHPDDRALVLASRDQIRQGVCPAPYEYRAVRPDGAIRMIRRHTELFLDDRGMPIRVAGTVHDITEQYAAQQRQSELERQLLHSQKLDALGTLAGGIAHDLNNTLVPVLGLAKLTLERLPEQSRERANLTTILRAGERARDLVRQILAFSRKDAPTRQAVDLALLLRESLKLLRSSLPATVQIRETIEDVGRVEGDPAQLHQIAVNLVVNAAQAIGERMGAIAVTLEPAPAGALDDDARRPGRPVVQLSVSDTGCGMDEQTRQRIFEPFFTTKPVGEGTGLGLSVVHGIVLRHGGRITVTSKPGGGTRFDILLPALAEEDAAGEIDPAPQAVA